MLRSDYIFHHQNVRLFITNPTTNQFSSNNGVTHLVLFIHHKGIVTMGKYTRTHKVWIKLIKLYYSHGPCCHRTASERCVQGPSAAPQRVLSVYRRSGWALSNNKNKTESFLWWLSVFHKFHKKIRSPSFQQTLPYCCSTPSIWTFCNFFLTTALNYIRCWNRINISFNSIFFSIKKYLIKLLSNCFSKFL